MDLSDDEAGGVEVGVGLAEGGDDAVATAFGGAEMDEENLVFVVVDEVGEEGAATDEVGGGELAFEDGELEVVSEGAHGFEDLAEALVVGDVVTDQVGLAHLWVILADFWKMRGEGVGEDKAGMSDQRIWPSGHILSVSYYDGGMERGVER